MHTYPWHVGDFLKDCAHLTDAEELAYRRLIDLYYTQEGPIPNRTHWVTRRIRMAGQEKMVGSVLREFFTLEGGEKDGFWHQKRCDAELLKYQKRVVANKENGKKGGRKPSGEPRANPVGSKPRTRTRTNKSPLPPEGAEGMEGFHRWYDAYPLHCARQDAERAWAKLKPDAAMLEMLCAAVAKQLASGHFTNLSGKDAFPYPATWLNGRRWEDAEKPAQAASGGPAAQWWDSRQGIMDKAMQLGLPGPTQPQLDSPNEWLAYVAGVWLAAGDGPWIDERATVYRFYVRLRNGSA